jgi:hypothetical protein
VAIYLNSEDMDLLMVLQNPPKVNRGLAGTLGLGNSGGRGGRGGDGGACKTWTSNFLF